MKRINLFLMDMSHAGNTSGVDRYITTLLKGLESYPNIQVCWIHLRHDAFILFHKEETFSFYRKITIPLPQQFNEIISGKFWINKYNEQVYRITKYLFEGKKNCIIHIHTLNLIDLATYIRSQAGCKIITHLHCIPWKGLYNSDTRRFNKLYDLLYIRKTEKPDRHEFITNNSELRSYTDADHIICVTQCAEDFLRNVMVISHNNISVIPNGINDFQVKNERRREKADEIFNMLYVGVLSESKGLKYILQAMRKVKEKGYQVSLTIAGAVESIRAKSIKEMNKDLMLNMLGRIPFTGLTGYYRKSDAGIIASLQEQSSYVAIEMAMFGLPIITTAVDGLDEIFTDRLNALKVNTRFSKVFGLSVDTTMMADKIITLIKDKDLRIRLGKEARALYERELTLQRMMQQTVRVYQKVTGETEYV